MTQGFVSPFWPRSPTRRKKPSPTVLGGGRDLIDELGDHLTVATHDDYRLALMGALAALDDPRVAPMMKTLFRAATRPREAALAARRLLREPDFDRTHFFTPFLDSSPAEPQARTAANALADLPPDTPAQGVRIALLCDLPYPTPPVNDETEEIWWLESLGPRSAVARTLLENMGPEAYDRIRHHGEEGPEEWRAWLLEWGGRVHPAMTVESILKALRNGSDRLRERALDVIAVMEGGPALFVADTTPLTDSPDPGVRRAALRAGGTVTDVRVSLHEEADLSCRLLLIDRLPRLYGTEAADDLSRLMGDEEWRVRNVAAMALAQLGETGRATAQRLLQSEREVARIAAAQTLMALDGEGEETPPLFR